MPQQIGLDRHNPLEPELAGRLLSYLLALQERLQLRVGHRHLLEPGSVALLLWYRLVNQEQKRLSIGQRNPYL
jgi:hypothetical protein